MSKRTALLILVLIASTLTHMAPVAAQTVPGHAKGLREALIAVDLPSGAKQTGVYSAKEGTEKPGRLAVLLPGSPSVVRPVVENGAMTQSRLTGNFLIRARRHLADESIATLIVDCHSDSGDECASSYQASKQRQEDVDRLIAETRKQNPSITEVWLVGTSMGTISSSFMPLHNAGGYTGAIHTAAITDPYRKGSYRELAGFNYSNPQIPQFFVHHRNDPCALTPYGGAKTLSEKFNIPLLTVQGGSDFQGDACAAYTEHGFKGREREVMRAIADIIKSAKLNASDIN